jgi:hypothetical protein
MGPAERLLGAAQDARKGVCMRETEETGRGLLVGRAATERTSTDGDDWRRGRVEGEHQADRDDRR